MTDSHVPVMLEECLAILGPALGRPGAAALDATLGLGGHAEAMLEAHPGLRLLGLDRDPAALASASARLGRFGGRVRTWRGTYDQIREAMAAVGWTNLDAVLFDLGVSSMQLDRDERGFAYSRDAPLDMRMDPTSGPTAADILNTYSQTELARVLRDLGEERFAVPIARAVIRERQRDPFTSSARLSELIREVIPAPARRTGGNPAKRTFQALRMEVNRELDHLRRAMPGAISALGPGGRMVVLSYHSGEDRIVKQAIRRATEPDVPPGLPVIPEELQPIARVLTRGAARASEDEVQRNPRAASVRLRAVEKVDARAREVR